MRASEVGDQAPAEEAVSLRVRTRLSGSPVE